MNRLTLSDFCTAGAPVIGSFFAKLTLAEVNTLAQIVGTGLGAAYLVWKWRREARADVTPPASR